MGVVGVLVSSYTRTNAPIIQISLSLSPIFLSFPHAASQTRDEQHAILLNKFVDGGVSLSPRCVSLREVRCAFARGSGRPKVSSTPLGKGI
jgi:hypothetical protein